MARELIGCSLVIPPASGQTSGEATGQTSGQSLIPVSYMIVETEAYTQDDPACHAYQKTKGRAATLYKSPGLAYVYFIYGMYHCLNVVTEPEGTAGAVLIRALAGDEQNRTNGPGRLTKALGITKALHNEIDLTAPQSPMYLIAGDPVPDSDIVQTTRIGIKKAADYPWRFYLKDSPWVSYKQ